MKRNEPEKIELNGVSYVRADSVDITARDSRVVVRKGRMKADGSRVGARVRHKITAYLEPDLSKRLDQYALVSCIEKSDVVAEALCAYLGYRES